MMAALTQHHSISPPQTLDRIAPLAVIEKDHILNAYRKTGHNKLQTAKLLDIGLNTLRRKLKEYGQE